MIDIDVQQSLGNIQLDLKMQLPGKGITAVFGRSGAGKTSLINMISGISVPDRGVISINNHQVYDSRSRLSLAIEKRNIGYVFQDARLFPHYSVKGNLTYGTKQPDEQEFDHVIKLLSIEHLLARKPSELSGGEKQRVAIGRALLSKPDLLLMDEPLASLDLPRKREVMPFLEKLSKEVEIPIIYVTHSLNEILRLADHMVLLVNGKVESCGPLEQVWQSDAMRPWQSFSEQSSVFEAHIATQHPDYALTQLELTPDKTLWVQKVAGETGEPVRVQVRANDVSISCQRPQQTSIRNIIPVTISVIESLQLSQDKQSVAVKLELDESRALTANLTQWAVDDLGLEVGQKVYAQIKGVSVTQRDMISIKSEVLNTKC